MPAPESVNFLVAGTKILNTRNLKEERFDLAHSLRGFGAQSHGPKADIMVEGPGGRSRRETEHRGRAPQRKGQGLDASPR